MLDLLFEKNPGKVYRKCNLQNLILHMELH
uniref:Uncharacterized protein n=1 Tax=Arundo donax TaxID=35708 RepID=A0A0A9CF91_ARUDO